MFAQYFFILTVYKQLKYFFLKKNTVNIFGYINK